jgi:hypothetical protein
MIMQMLEAGKLETVTDEHRRPDESNPRGYLELERVKALEAGDVDWVAGARGKAVKVIAYLLEYLPPNLDYRVIFIIRNLEEVLASQAKMLALLGESGNEDGAVEDGILGSSTSLDGSEEDPPPAGAPPQDAHGRMREIFYGHLARARRLLARESRFSVLYLRHDEVLGSPEGAARKIASFIGGGLDVRAMAGAVDPALHRTRVGE